ncbi:hypothetical protein ACFYSC_10845 [Streptosporangium sp. NPDC004379]
MSETSAGSLSVSPDLTPEEFAVLDEMRRAAAAERGRGLLTALRSAGGM